MMAAWVSGSARRSLACRFRYFGLLVAWLGIAVAAHAQAVDGSYRQSVDDAWWTGPMLANSAATLPRGHFLIEPYLYDVSSSQADGFGSLTYMLYGVSDRFTAGLVPVFGYTRVAGGADSSGIGAGDASVLMQY